MPLDRNMLAGLMSRITGPQRPLSFEELLMQERGDRDTAALRYNAMQGSPGSMAYGAPPPAAPPALTPATGAPTPTPSPGAVPVPTPRPYEPTSRGGPPIRPVEQGVVTPTPLDVATPTPPQVATETPAKGKITEYGDARRGAVGKVKRPAGWLLKQLKIHRGNN